VRALAQFPGRDWRGGGGESAAAQELYRCGGFALGVWNGSKPAT
jgi:hypothetical protein